MSCQFSGWTRALLKGGSCPHSFSISWWTALQHRFQLASPGVHLPGNVQCRFTDQLYADDLVLVTDSPLDLQTALNAVHRWWCRFRFKFGVGSTKSAVMAFGPRRRLPDFDLHLGGVSLPVVSSYKYLGVLLTPTLSCTKHVQLLISRGNRLFAQCVAWCRAEHLPSPNGIINFPCLCSPQCLVGGQNFSHNHQQLCTSWMVQFADGVVTFWAGLLARLVLVYFANLDGLTLNTWRWNDSSLFWDAPFPWPQVLDAHSPPLSTVWRLNHQGTWTHHALAMCAHLDIPSPFAAGIHPQSPPHRVRRWVDLVVSPSLNLAPCLSAPSLLKLRAQWSTTCLISPQFAQAWTAIPGSLILHLFSIRPVRYVLTSLLLVLFVNGLTRPAQFDFQSRSLLPGGPLLAVSRCEWPWVVLCA